MTIAEFHVSPAARYPEDRSHVRDVLAALDAADARYVARWERTGGTCHALIVWRTDDDAAANLIAPCERRAIIGTYGPDGTMADPAVHVGPDDGTDDGIYDGIYADSPADVARIVALVTTTRSDDAPCLCGDPDPAHDCPVTDPDPQATYRADLAALVDDRRDDLARMLAAYRAAQDAYSVSVDTDADADTIAAHADTMTAAADSLAHAAARLISTTAALRRTTEGA